MRAFASSYPHLSLSRSVNAKQLAHPALQADPSRCESGHGCHAHGRRAKGESRKQTVACLGLRLSSFDPRPFSRSQGVISSARRSAKAEVRGANPRESANSKAPVPQQLQERFRKPLFVGASPTRGSNFADLLLRPPLTESAAASGRRGEVIRSRPAGSAHAETGFAAVPFEQPKLDRTRTR